MKIGVFGANGALGSQIILELKKNNDDVVPIMSKETVEGHQWVNFYESDNSPWASLRNCSPMRKLFETNRFDIIVNTVAWNITDKAEQEVSKCFHLNTVVVHELVHLCNEFDVEYYHVSTDYVMGVDATMAINGAASGLVSYGKHFSADAALEGLHEDVAPDPRNVYAISKYAGEQIVLNYCNEGYILRVSGLFGPVGSSAKNGRNFVFDMVEKAKRGEEIKVVNDQWMLPTYTVDAAKMISTLLEDNTLNKQRIFHVCNSGSPLTWFEFAKEIVSYVQTRIYQETCVIPVSTGEFYSTIPRCNFTALKNNSSYPMRYWKEALHEFMMEFYNNNNNNNGEQK